MTYIDTFPQEKVDLVDSVSLLLQPHPHQFTGLVL